MKKIKVVSILLLFFAICILGSFTISNIKSMNSEAHDQANKSDVAIKKMLEDTLSICSLEYSYEDVITHKQTWIMGLNASLAAAKFDGKIKMGSEVKEVNENGDKYYITLSHPVIITHDLNRQGEWRDNEKIFNNFQPNEEGEIIATQKELISKRVLNELKQKTVKYNEKLIQDLLTQYGIDSNSIFITYT